MDGLAIFVGTNHAGASALQFFLQLEGIALDGKVEVPNGKPAHDVANRSTAQINVHVGGAGNFLNHGDAPLLIGRQPDFHRVNVVSHADSEMLNYQPQRGFSQDFHKWKPRPIRMPGGALCNLLSLIDLDRADGYRRSTENTTRLTIWLLGTSYSHGFRSKMRESPVQVRISAILLVCTNPWHLPIKKS